jgi:uncharacterized protein YndB with AHSA1/START domain
MTPAPERAPMSELVLTRIFDAPREQVFKVWTEPRFVALWWGLEGTSVPRCEMDVRPGGTWRIDMRTPGPDGTVYPNSGVFLEVIENERLVYTDVADPNSPAWKGAPPGDRLNIVTFENEGSGTRVTLRVQFKTPEDYDFFVGTGFPGGLAQSLDRLGRLLLRIQAGGDRGRHD